MYKNDGTWAFSEEAAGSNPFSNSIQQVGHRAVIASRPKPGSTGEIDFVLASGWSSDKHIAYGSYVVSTNTLTWDTDNRVVVSWG